MKTHIFIFSLLLWLGMTSCSNSETSVQATTVDSTAVRKKTDSLNGLKASETFRGTYQNQDVVFSHTNFQSYTLSTAGVARYGHLNTERGWGDYPDATVYILDDNKPEKEQRYFVRTTSGRVHMLDGERYVVDEAFFTTTEVAKPEVEISSKPVTAKVSKSVKRKHVKKRHTRRKPARKKNSGAAAVQKEAPAKKILKSSKKKEAIHTKRKKARRKKSNTPTPTQ